MLIVTTGGLTVREEMIELGGKSVYPMISYLAAIALLAGFTLS